MKGVQTAEFELHKPIDEQMGFHEKLRLLYVACTRARDHLVVSVHRKAHALRPDDRPALDARRAAVGRGRNARTGPRRMSAPRAEPAAPRRRYPRPPSPGSPPRRGRRSTTGRMSAATGADSCRRPRSRTGSTPSNPVPARARGRSRIPGSRRTPAISNCRRGTRAATAPRSAAPCTPRCRRRPRDRRRRRRDRGRASRGRGRARVTRRRSPR